jgi:hypothetical protein
MCRRVVDFLPGLIRSESMQNGGEASGGGVAFRLERASRGEYEFGNVKLALSKRC